MPKFIDADEAVLRGKSIALKHIFRQERKSQINSLSGHVKNLKKKKAK